MNVTMNATLTTVNDETIKGYTVAAHKEGHYSMMLKEGGLAHFPQEEVKEFKTGKKVSVMEFERPEMEGQPAEKKERKPRAKNGPSKMDRAVELIGEKVLEIPRKEAIEILVKELDMTPAGASTYHATIKKKMKGAK